MPAEQQVTIIILGKDSASKVFQSVGQQAQQAGKEIDKGFADKLKAAGDKAGELGKKMSIGVTAPLAIFGGMAVNSAVKAERLTKTLEGLAGGADEASKYIKAIQEASLGTIPKVDALAIANRSLSFGIVKNQEEMAKLTKIAITLGRAQGLDAARAVSDLSTALSRQSPLILDNLGITLKLTEAYRIYAEKIGKSVDALTAEEKAIAFREAALIKGMETVERMGGLQDDMASAGERVKAQMSDLATEIGTMLIPVMQMGIDVIGPLVKAFINLDDGAKKIIVAVAAVAAAAGPMMVKFKLMTNVVTGLIGVLPTVAAMLGNVGSAFQLLREGVSVAEVASASFSATTLKTAKALGAVGLTVGAAIAVYQKWQDVNREAEEGTEDAAEAIGKWSGRAEEMLAQGKELSNVVSEMAGRVNEASDAFHTDGNVVVDLAAAYARSKGETKTMSAAQAEIHGIILKNTSSWREYAKAVNEYNATVENSAAKIEMLSETELYLARHTEQLNAMYERFRTGMEQTREAIVYTEQDLDRMDKTMSSHDAALLNVAQNYDTVIGATDQHRAAIIANYVATQEAAARQEEYATKVQEAQARVAQYAEEAAARQKAAAEEAARGQAGLISAMQDATQEMFNQQVLAAIDPAEIGVEAWASLGQELGLLDQKQVNLATAASDLIDAFRDGIVPTENMAEATTALYEAADQANPPIQEILDKYAKAPGLIGPSKEAMEAHNEKMRLLGEEYAPGAAEEIEGFTGKVEIARTPVRELSEEVNDLGTDLKRVAKRWEINVVTTYSRVGTPPAIPPGGTPGPGGSRQMGGPIHTTGTYLLHAGEVVLNPYRAGAMGGPGGPPPPASVTQNLGGDTYNVTINDRLAMALFLEEQRQKRFKRLNARM